MQIKNKKYKAAIIGAGNIGFKFSLFGNNFSTTHFEAYKENKQTALVGVVEPDLAIHKEIKINFSGNIYSNAGLMLQEIKPEIVSVCVPDGKHFEILKEVLASPNVKGVWMEKPLAISLSEARAMVQICENKKIPLLVNFVRRYDPFYQYIKNNLFKLVGEVQAVNFYYSGGIVTTGSHMLDLLSYFFGECSRVSCEMRASSYFGRLYFGNIIVNIVPLETKNFSIFEMDIVGTKARLQTINKPFGEYAYRYYVLENSKKIKAKFIARKEQRPIKENFPRNYMAEALNDLLKCVTIGTEPVSSGKTALKSLEIMHALIYSSENEGEIMRLPFLGVIKNLPSSLGDIKK